ncbi:MAG: SPASM domain-containing protein [Candidatus Methylomirabilales bacterium]
MSGPCGHPPLPTNLYFEVTNRCNLPCRTCVRTFNLHEPERDPLPHELKQAAGALPDLRRVVLHGIGEPLLNKNLPEMIRFAKAQGAWVLFNSNGILLDGAWQDALIDCGLDELRISLDAATPETFRKIRGAPALPRILANLRRFVARKAERGVAHPRLSLWMVAMRANIAELPGLVDLAAELGVPEVYFQRLVFTGLGAAQRDQSLYGQADGEVAAIIREAEARAEASGVALRASGATSPLGSLAQSREPRPWSRCRRPWTSTYVTAHGKVLPCCIAPFAHRDFPGMVLGDLARTSLEEVWRGEAYRRFRERLLSDDPHPCCQTCGVGWSL